MQLGYPNLELSAAAGAELSVVHAKSNPPLGPQLPIPRRILAQLAATELTPSPQVDRLFGELVDFALATQNPEILADIPALRQLHALCARAEGELEQHWAQRIAEKTASIDDFPYWGNYLALSQGENAALQKNTHGFQLVFIGCGPLPLSAVALLQVEPRWQLTCIDSDPQAIDTAACFLASVGLESKIATEVSAGEEFDYGSADIALLASLAGTSTQAKLQILRQVARTSRAGALIAARSVPADGRRLLYPMLDPEQLTAGLGWSLQDQWQPQPPVINSLLILRRSEESGTDVGD